MLGTIVNTVAIIIGGFLGIFLRKGIPDSYKKTIMQGIGLCTLLIGLMGAFETENTLLLVVSIVLGSLIGEKINIEYRLEQLGLWLEKRTVQNGKDSVSKGFVTASLIFCVGAMAIVGSLESGLMGNYETLYIKSLLDGISSIIFASTMGIGVVFSAFSVFIYQGLITITAEAVKYLLVEDVIREMSAIGGLLIVGIGLNVLDIKKISVANMLPAIFLPILYLLLDPVFIKITNIVQNIF
ncbi:MAG: DUF554 domain-containing protein [Clostridiales bacterium]|nr:DUF554 domain-containing protein [Clostridiales bacterium]